MGRSGIRNQRRSGRETVAAAGKEDEASKGVYGTGAGLLAVTYTDGCDLVHS